MDVKQQKLLTKLVKATKTDMFIINPDGIIGTDKFSTTLTISRLSTGILTPVEMTKDAYVNLDKLLFGKSDIPDAEFNQLLIQNSIFRITTSPIINIANNIRQCIGIENAVIDIVDLKADPKFNEILSKKAADGNSLYRIDKNYILSIFSGLLPINKNDKVSFRIYDNNTNNSFIAEFNIDKGFTVVTKYIQYLKM